MTEKTKDWEEVIQEFSRNETTKVVLKVGVYRQKPFIDLRTYFQPEGEEDFIGTKKGVRLHAESISDLREALQKADEKISSFFT